MSQSPHRLVNPGALAPPSGFSHAAVAGPGQVIYLGGQTGHLPDGTLAGEDVVTQFGQACANVVTALEGAGGRPEHLVQMIIYATDLVDYRSVLRELGETYREHFGRHFPAMALIGVRELFDPAAKVELMGVAVVPD